MTTNSEVFYNLPFFERFIGPTSLFTGIDLFLRAFTGSRLISHVIFQSLGLILTVPSKPQIAVSVVTAIWFVTGEKKSTASSTEKHFLLLYLFLSAFTQLVLLFHWIFRVFVVGGYSWGDTWIGRAGLSPLKNNLIAKPINTECLHRVHSSTASFLSSPKWYHLHKTKEGNWVGDLKPHQPTRRGKFAGTAVRSCCSLEAADRRFFLLPTLPLADVVNEKRQK